MITGQVLEQDALLERVRHRLAEAPGRLSPALVATAIRAESGGVLGDTDLLAALRVLQTELTGAGPLEALLREPDTADVLVTAPDEVWVDRGAGLVRTDVRFTDEAAVRRLAQRLALSAGRRLDEAQPWETAGCRRRDTAAPGCGCMPYCPRSRRTGRRCRCGCCARPPRDWTLRSPPALCQPVPPDCWRR